MSSIDTEYKRPEPEQIEEIENELGIFHESWDFFDKNLTISYMGE